MTKKVEIFDPKAKATNAKDDFKKSSKPKQKCCGARQTSPDNKCCGKLKKNNAPKS